MPLIKPLRLLTLARWHLLLPFAALQAGSNVPGNVAAVKRLMSHPAFNINNPNNCYSLFLGFARSPVNFHAGGQFWLCCASASACCCASACACVLCVRRCACALCLFA